MKNWSKKGSLWKRKIKLKHHRVVQNHTFGLFEKNRKIDAKWTPKSCHFWLKIDLWAARGRLILRFGRFLARSKKRWFFDVASGSQKINKNRALGAPGSPESLWLVVRVAISAAEGPRAAANYQRNRWIDDKNSESARSNTPLGLKARRIFWWRRNLAKVLQNRRNDCLRQLYKIVAAV